AGLERAFGLVAPACNRGVQGICLDCICQADALAGNPSARRVALPGLTRHGVLHTLPGIQRDDGPVAAEGKNSSALLDALPWPSAGGTVRPRVPRPDFQGVVVGIGMQGLHTGDHTQLAETGNVLCCDGFDVLDSWTGVVRVVRFGGLLVRVQRKPHGLSSDGMSEDLQPAPVQLGYGLLVL